jgi:hypothetical protein
MTLTRNQVAFTKQLIAVQVQTFEGLGDAVRQINWRLTCTWVTAPTPDTWVWKLYVNTDLGLPNSQSFVAYQDLDAATIMSWLALSEQQETEYEEKCLKQFSDHVSASLANRQQQTEQDYSNFENRRWIDKNQGS